MRPRRGQKKETEIRTRHTDRKAILASSASSTLVFFFVFVFFKFLADTYPFWGPLVPLFWISGDVSSGFQSQSGFCLIRYFCGGECNVHSPRFTSGATLADLLAAGTQLVTYPHACAEVGLGSVSNMQSHEQKTNALPLCHRPGLVLFLINLRYLRCAIYKSFIAMIYKPRLGILFL